jgi:predicted alpha/beta hydrolase family esterase
MKQKCLIIHGCPSNVERAMDAETRTYDKHWIPWITNELLARGITAKAPLMPTPWAPDYEKFKQEFSKYAVDENTILIGHSCGCSFLVRWLGETKQKVHKLILVAPWKISDDRFKKEFYGFDIDETISDRVDEIFLFTADDEEEDGKKGLVMYHDALGGKIIDLPGRGHYTQDDMGTIEFPELLKCVLD